MRILLIHPVADYSTNEVWEGLRDGLRALDHQVVEYEYGSRVLACSYALQRAWGAARLGPRPTREDAYRMAGDGIYAKIMEHGVDATIIVNGELWHPDHTILLRRGGMPVGLVLTESPYADEAQFLHASFANIAWTNERTSVDRLQAACQLAGSDTVVRYLPSGFNATKHKPGTAAPDTPSHDVVIVGTGFEERIELLSAVPWKDMGVNLGLYGDWQLAVPRLARRRNLSPVLAPYLSRLPFVTGRYKLMQYIAGGFVANDTATDLYRNATIGVNLFRASTRFGVGSSRVDTAESMAPRFYELAACGAFVISERRDELVEQFGDIVPTFDKPDELADLVRYWLAHPAERAQRVARLSAAVAEHSYTHRAAQMVRDLTEAVAAKAAPHKE